MLSTSHFPVAFEELKVIKADEDQHLFFFFWARDWFVAIRKYVRLQVTEVPDPRKLTIKGSLLMERVVTQGNHYRDGTQERKSKGCTHLNKQGDELVRDPPAGPTVVSEDVIKKRREKNIDAPRGTSGLHHSYRVDENDGCVTFTVEYRERDEAKVSRASSESSERRGKLGRTGEYRASPGCSYSRRYPEIARDIALAGVYVAKGIHNAALGRTPKLEFDIEKSNAFMQSTTRVPRPIQANVVLKKKG
ncbi:hypothetical protein V8E53_007967 [Lactarius tabidus]